MKNLFSDIRLENIDATNINTHALCQKTENKRVDNITFQKL